VHWAEFALGPVAQCAARGHAGHGLGRSQRARRAAQLGLGRRRARRTARRRCTATVRARRCTETVGRRRLTGVETATGDGERGDGRRRARRLRVRTAATAWSETGRRERGSAVQASAARARRSAGVRRERGSRHGDAWLRSAARASGARVLSGHGAVPTALYPARSARRVVATRQRRATAAISELKFTPTEISRNQIAGD
jgi:hypothetical protein